MGLRLRTTVLLLLGIPLAGCSSGGSTEPEGLQVEAQQDMLVSEEPLQDVVLGHLTQGDQVIALCFVRRAQSNMGLVGSAIKVNTGDLTGYAAVTDLTHDPADRKQIFDLDAAALSSRLSACGS